GEARGASLFYCAFENAVLPSSSGVMPESNASRGRWVFVPACHGRVERHLPCGVCRRDKTASERALCGQRVYVDESLPQNLFKRLALCEFIDEFVEIANFLHERVLNFLHANAAHHALDKGDIWVDLRCLGEESLEVGLRFDLAP